MGYYTRAFCKSTKIPSVSEILDSLNSKGYSVSSNLTETEIRDENWRNFELSYKHGKLPILVELNKINTSEGLVEEEISEFEEKIGKARFFDIQKKKVIAHLKQTQYILCNQLPSFDVVEKGYKVNWELLKLMANEYDGMIQCDGEGFYREEKLILKV